MTIKLYDEDATLRVFRGRVLSCVQAEGGYDVVLDRTAFFPEEGGQTSDTGVLGGARVLDVQIKKGVITHKTDAPLAIGDTVEGEIEWETRYRKMQNHTAEHIFSGTCHRLYGCKNVGFHLGSRDMTVDFDRELTREELSRAERIVNEVITACLPVIAEYPSSDVLETLSYRSKLALTEGVRIVTIPDVDVCACCAPHVRTTGEIGIFKVLDFLRYKGGVRVHLLAGYDALEDYHRRYLATAEISSLLSLKQEEVSEGVARLYAELTELRRENGYLQRDLVRSSLSVLPRTEGNLLLFRKQTDADILRECANAALEKCGDIAAVFGGEEGAYRYVIVARESDLSVRAKELNTALRGRGGGSRDMLRGTSCAGREEIASYFGDTFTVLE